MTAHVYRFDDRTALNAAAAEKFTAAAVGAVDARGVFNVALSGGSTPAGLFTLLATDPGFSSRIPWDRAQIFWSDERHVPPDSKDSNYRMAHETLLSRVPIGSGQVHRVQAEDPDAGAVAQRYEEEIRSVIGRSASIPRFDLMLLGLGADGHTASLFPGTPALTEARRLVVANWVEAFAAYRITMTLPIINAARLVMFLVAGMDKAIAVRDVLRSGGGGAVLPASLVRPTDGHEMWFLDAEAAMLL
ncbi:MAG TPA: 6-phosphogluconolactonase [Vicinamibacterales bacterium]|nr:6-phosphogluconolactonase [Vicinamibacterales bacterium]